MVKETTNPNRDTSNKLRLDLPEGWDAGLTAEERQQCLDAALQTALTEVARKKAAGGCPSWCQDRDDAKHVKGGTDHHGPMRHVEATGSEPWIELDEGATYSGASASAYQERLDTAPHISLNIVHVQPPFEAFEGRRETLWINLRPEEAKRLAQNLLAAATEAQS